MQQFDKNQFKFMIQYFFRNLIKNNCEHTNISAAAVRQKLVSIVGDLRGYHLFATVQQCTCHPIPAILPATVCSECGPRVSIQEQGFDQSGRHLHESQQSDAHQSSNIEQRIQRPFYNGLHTGFHLSTLQSWPDTKNIYNQGPSH